ncbi:glutamine--tRNA ligase/YqeY domain fusion protein [Eubacterium coprostanoligenes]|uniref:Glutamine--tRNA ligase n=1 Tax=Eubacterium coprostanoligenes TaxID=290054 RepID=A0A1T4MVG9_9FIRM|nr:glutamine--tRNA ligase/YqeY domain fusion protein [Eubacterium coprostanoligenes]SJZ70807.1 glutaminyl-tRNA synthetase [Eubacterium coprostanoligenes]
MAIDEIKDEETVTQNFIHDFIDEDLKEGVYSRVQTRFPPEPNGYLHIGHAKAICINFGVKNKYNGVCNLRMDDTNPIKEDTEYVESIKEDIKWLGFDWDNIYFASDYFDYIYECAVKLIKKGLAYVDESSADEIREMRGTLTEPGKNSPYRDRPIEESLDLFQRMTDGEFEAGSKVLRAKIDMASPNMNMRDPIIYRIMYAHHHRTGDKWCVYPMYDFAHPLSDACEKVTHSLCSLEFENHRPLYDWVCDNCVEGEKPRQIEFARMNLNYTLTSKRKCLKLVQDKIVDGWDDPRMATISGMRRRGYPADAIRDFCEKIGVSKAYSVIDFAMLESCVRDSLNRNAKRAMAVVDPLKLIIDNYPEDKVEELEVEYHPDHEEFGKRTIPFGKELWIEKNDFMVEPISKYRRLFVGNEVRLYKAYCVTCTGYDLDENGEVIAVHATYDPETFGGDTPDGRKVRGTIHWVCANDCNTAEVRLYDRLFNVENPSDEEGVGSFEDNLNPDSLEVKTAYVEKALAGTHPGDRFQFMRIGYFCTDKDSKPDALVFNRTVQLRDSFNKKK